VLYMIALSAVTLLVTLVERRSWWWQV